MRMRDLIQEAGGETVPAWPPSWIDTVFQRSGNLPAAFDGVLKAVLPSDGVLVQLTMTFDGRDYAGRLTWDGPPMLSAVERLLKTHVGQTIRDIADLEIAGAPVPLSREHDRRYHPRSRISWPVVVEAGTNRYTGSSVDISTQGARVRMKLELEPGTLVQLELFPPENVAIRVGAVVARVEAQGLAFSFRREVEHPRIRRA